MEIYPGSNEIIFNDVSGWSYIEKPLITSIAQRNEIYVDIIYSGHKKSIEYKNVLVPETENIHQLVNILNSWRYS